MTTRNDGKSRRSSTIGDEAAVINTTSNGKAMTSQRQRGNLPCVSKEAVKKFSDSIASATASTPNLTHGQRTLHHHPDRPGRKPDPPAASTAQEGLQVVCVPSPRFVTDDGRRMGHNHSWITALAAMFPYQKDLDEVQEKESTALLIQHLHRFLDTASALPYPTSLLFKKNPYHSPPLSEEDQSPFT